MRQKSKRSRLILVGFLLVLSPLFRTDNLAEPLGGTLRLTLGQQRVLDVSVPLEQVAIGDPEVVDVKVITQGRQVLITASGKGTTDLITWDIHGKQTTTLVNVILKDIRLIRNEVRGIIGPVEGVRVRLVGEQVVIDGEVFTAKDLERLQKVADIYPNEVTLLARMSPSVSRLIASEVSRSLKLNGFSDTRARGIGDKIFIEGTVNSREDIRAVMALAQGYYVECVNLLSLEGRADDLVLIDIHFIEVGKSLGEKIGVNWDDSARFEIQNISYTIDILRRAPDSGQMSLTGADGFGADVNLSETDSFARTLAHPRLVCKSGQEADFLAGGKVPYVVQGLGGGSVIFKDYGISLKISPIVHQDGRISAGVLAESSKLDWANAVLGYPAISTRMVETYVTLGRGKVLTLSGLVNQSDAKDVDRMPVIGNFPILGELFKSRDFSDDDSELVIFLSAELMTPETSQNLDMIKSAEERFKKGDEKLKPHVFD